jgi:hypothetical protein
MKHTLIALILAISLALCGCSKPAGVERQRRQKFQIVSLDKVNGSLGEGWRITVTAANNTASNIHITAASAFVYHNGRKIGRLALNGDIFLPRRRCSQVEIPLRITLANPLTALSTINKIRKGDFSGITIDYSVTIATLTSHRILEDKGVSLEELARQFNLGLKK